MISDLENIIEINLNQQDINSFKWMRMICGIIAVFGDMAQMLTDIGYQSKDRLSFYLQDLQYNLILHSIRVYL